MHRHIGIYAGTFDPIHPGHVAFALEAKSACRLDSVVFLPELAPRNKQEVASLDHRVTLIRHEIAGRAGLCTAKLRSECFTIKDTLPELYGIFGPVGLTFLLGSDVVRSLAQWEDIGQLLQRHALAIGMRADDSNDEIAAEIHNLEELLATPIRYALIRTSQAHLSSSRLKVDTSGFSKLRDESQEYIQEHGLYAPHCFGTQTPSTPH